MPTSSSGSSSGWKTVPPSKVMGQYKSPPGRKRERSAGKKPLHHRSKTCSSLEDLQRLLWGGARQCSDQALPDGLIQRSVVDALLGSEIAREAIGVGDRHGSCT